MVRVSITTKALLAICNNCKPIEESKIRVDYSKEEGLTLEIGDDRRSIKQKKAEIKQKKEYSYELGIPINPILNFVYGAGKKHPIARRTNLNNRLKTLEKKKIIIRTGQARFAYTLNMSLSAFKNIVRHLSAEQQLSKLAYTDYFKIHGIKHFDALFDKIPENLLDLDMEKPEQTERNINYTYPRLLKSATFMDMLVSDNLNTRMAELQKSLNMSYLRQQGVKDNFPFVQLLGTYCTIIDYLKGNIQLTSGELTEHMNDTERAVFRVFHICPLPKIKQKHKKEAKSRKNR